MNLTDYKRVAAHGLSGWTLPVCVPMGDRTRKSSARPPATWRTGLRNYMWVQQDETCPVCGITGTIIPGPDGEPMDDEIQFNHTFPRTPAVLGFIPGGVFSGHAACNMACARMFGTVRNGIILDGGVIPFDHFARPDLIIMEWPSTAVLATMRDRA